MQGKEEFLIEEIDLLFSIKNLTLVGTDIDGVVEL
jgi:hypothetical protein